MKKYIAVLGYALFMGACNNVDNKTAPAGATVASKDTLGKIITVTGKEIDTLTKSIKAHVSQNINGRHIRISYHSPAVRNRIIWGGLVPFDEPWVSGAHMATTIETESNIIINQQTIPAGKYAFFTIPSKMEWTLILNKNWQQHLTDEYDSKDDVIRWQVKADSLSYVQERLRYALDQTGEYKGSFDLRWEKVRITVPFELTR